MITSVKFKALATVAMLSGAALLAGCSDAPPPTTSTTTNETTTQTTPAPAPMPAPAPVIMGTPGSVTTQTTHSQSVP
jgi:hypothetical protein